MPELNMTEMSIHRLHNMYFNYVSPEMGDPFKASRNSRGLTSPAHEVDISNGTAAPVLESCGSLAPALM